MKRKRQKRTKRTGPKAAPMIEPHPVTLDLEPTPEPKPLTERQQRERIVAQDMAEAVVAGKQSAEWQARRDWELNRQYDDAPMVGEPTWHQH